MSLLQLLTREADGHRVLEVEPNPEKLPFRFFENLQREALLWGNRDLLSVSAALVRSGFRAVSVSFTDQRGGPSGEEDSAELDDLLNELNLGNDAAAQRFLDDVFFGLIISRVNLRSRRPRMSLSLHPTGLIEVDSDVRLEDVRQLETMLLSA